MFSSTVSRQRIATITVPDPFGIDISADGNTTDVGTFTDFVYMLDPQKLVVTGRVFFRGSPASRSIRNRQYSLGGGHTLQRQGDAPDGHGRLGGGAGASVVIWDRIANQIVETIPTGYPADWSHG